MTYRSHADLGGRPGDGRVIPEEEGELFHAAWEPLALALTLAMGATGAWNIDMSRSARESLPDYPSSSYYEIWIKGLERLLQERALVRADELAKGRAMHPVQPLPRVLRAAEVGAVLAAGSPTARPARGVARFAIGDSVRTRSAQVASHTRLPGYARGKTGRIERLHGAHVFADSNAQGLGESPQWLYTVVFTARDLWGNESPAPDSEVSIDAWESYLERAG